MKVHFIAIGGSAMHNLALALHLKGYQVSGSDDEIFEPARSRLKNYGLLPEHEGWHPEMLNHEIDAVILGMHARADNPELERARELGLKIYSYPEFLYEQSAAKTRIVIGGSHGKTTITAMILHVLRACGIETDYMVGAMLEGFDVMVRLTESAKFMIFEGDEYLTSPVDRRPKFHLYRPHIALISGIAWDHINVFPTFENYIDQFRTFIQLIEPLGKLIFCSEDKVLSDLCGQERAELEKIPYHLPHVKRSGEHTTIDYKGKSYPLQVFGKHNLLNINAACEVCKLMGVKPEDFYQHITTFVGAANRLECLIRQEDFILFKDFAHAPSKVKATIDAVRWQYPEFRLVACLELHTYSSLSKQFMVHYHGLMNAADEAIVYFNPHAVQLKKLPPLDKDSIRLGFGRSDLLVFDNSSEMKDHLVSGKRNKEVLLMMSSGNFDGLEMKELFINLP